MSSSWFAARKASVFPHDGSQNPGGFLAVPVLHRSCFVISVTFSIGCWDTGQKVSHKKGLFCFLSKLEVYSYTNHLALSAVVLRSVQSATRLQKKILNILSLRTLI